MYLERSTFLCITGPKPPSGFGIFTYDSLALRVSFRLANSMTSFTLDGQNQTFFFFHSRLSIYLTIQKSKPLFLKVYLTVRKETFEFCCGTDYWCLLTDRNLNAWLFSAVRVFGLRTTASRQLWDLGRATPSCYLWDKETIRCRAA